jgi:hypothetical protein
MTRMSYHHYYSDNQKSFFTSILTIRVYMYIGVESMEGLFQFVCYNFISQFLIDRHRKKFIKEKKNVYLFESNTIRPKERS